MEYKKSVITMTLLRFSCLIHSLDNCVMTLSTELDLTGSNKLGQDQACMHGRRRRPCRAAREP